MNTTARPAITLVQRVPDAQWYGAQVANALQEDWLLQHPEAAQRIGEHVAGNVSGNADALIVDGPTLAHILEMALAHTYGDIECHTYGCGKRASWSNPCTCWRGDARKILDALKEARGGYG